VISTLFKNLESIPIKIIPSSKDSLLLNIYELFSESVGLVRIPRSHASMQIEPLWWHTPGTHFSTTVCNSLQLLHSLCFTCPCAGADSLVKPWGPEHYSQAKGVSTLTKSPSSELISRATSQTKVPKNLLDPSWPTGQEPKEHSRKSDTPGHLTWTVWGLVYWFLARE
jgi:hypothetical protein